MAEQTEQQAKTGQGEGHPPLPPDSMIILPVRQTVLFPGIVLPLAIGRKSSVAAAQDAVRGERMIGVMLQKDAAVEEPILAAEQLVLDERGEEVNRGERVGLGLEEARLEAGRHAGAAELPEGALELDEVHVGISSWDFRAMTSR